MIEPWWRAADDHAAAYTDAASVASLVAGSVDPDEATREQAALALSRVVKAIELEDEPDPGALAAIRARLPDIAGLLADNALLSGQAISILRRIRPDAATVARLLSLVAAAPPEERGILLEALGLCDDADWTPEVERVVRDHVGVPECEWGVQQALGRVPLRRR